MTWHPMPPVWDQSEFRRFGLFNGWGSGNTPLGWVFLEDIEDRMERRGDGFYLENLQCRPFKP